MLQHFLFITWNPSPDVPYAHIGNFSIKWYGIMWGLSLFSGFFLAQYIFRKLNRNEEKITIAIQYMFIGALIGARLAHVFFYSRDYYMDHPWEILMVWKGGLASHGGALGAIAGIYLFCKQNKEFGFFWMLDHAAICVLFLAALIRFGNLMNSEIIGKPTDICWAFVFTQVDNVPRHPVVLYECIAYILYQFFILYLFNRFRDSKPGIYVATFLFVFAIRFLLEFFKEPDGEMYGLISKTQLLNVPFIISGVIVLCLALKNKLKYEPVVNG